MGLIKADLLRCLESDLLEDNVNNRAPILDATILDGAAMVQMLNPKASRTFQEYGESVFRPASLKASTREKRGKGIRRRVAPSTVMLKNWSDFLRVNENKTELFGPP